MAVNKRYLDAEGLREVVEYFNNQLESLRAAIDLLNDTNGTPGSIQQKIDEAINRINIEDLNQSDNLTIYGGSSEEVIE